MHKQQTSPQIHRVSSTYTILLTAVSLVALLFASHKSIHTLTIKWINSEEYSHGFLLVFIAIFIGWHILAMKKPVIKPSWHGIWVLILAGILLTIGSISAFDTPGYYGLLLSIVGFCLAFFGTQTTRALLPSIIFLLFAIPLPRLLYFGLSNKLQLISSTLGVIPLRLAGIPVFQEGNIIDLGTIKLQVVDACSGLRYIFPLASFGYLIAFLMESSLWKRITVFASTIPIAILMNALRLSIIGFTVRIWGVSVAKGIIHDFEGWSVFVVCLVLLAGEFWLLERIGSKGRFRDEYCTIPKGKLFSNSIYTSKQTLVAFGLCIGLALLVGNSIVDAREELPSTHTSYASFPTTIQSWKGLALSLDAKALAKLQLTDYLMADYRRPGDNAPVSLYMAYYASQRLGSTLHAPTNCLSGSGWSVDERKEKTIYLRDGMPLRISRMVASSGESKYLIYYWFSQQGLLLTNEFTIRIYLLWNSIIKKRSDGTLFRVISPVLDSEKESDCDRRIEDFLNDAEPYFQFEAEVNG